MKSPFFNQSRRLRNIIPQSTPPIKITFPTPLLESRFPIESVASFLPDNFVEIFELCKGKREELSYWYMSLIAVEKNPTVLWPEKISIITELFGTKSEIDHLISKKCTRQEIIKLAKNKFLADNYYLATCIIERFQSRKITLEEMQIMVCMFIEQEYDSTFRFNDSPQNGKTIFNQAYAHNILSIIEAAIPNTVQLLQQYTTYQFESSHEPIHFDRLTQALNTSLESLQKKTEHLDCEHIKKELKFLQETIRDHSVELRNSIKTRRSKGDSQTKDYYLDIITLNTRYFIKLNALSEQAKQLEERFQESQKKYKSTIQKPKPAPQSAICEALNKPDEESLSSLLSKMIIEKIGDDKSQIKPDDKSPPPIIPAKQRDFSNIVKGDPLYPKNEDSRSITEKNALKLLKDSEFLSVFGSPVPHYQIPFTTITGWINKLGGKLEPVGKSGGSARLITFPDYVYCLNANTIKGGIHEPHERGEENVSGTIIKQIRYIFEKAYVDPISLRKRFLNKKPSR